MAAKEKCKICGQEFKRLSAHVKAHNVTWREYLRQYEPEQYEAEELIDLIEGLYVTERRKILIQAKGGTYLTFDTTAPEAKRRWPLNRADIKNHLEGRCALGIYFPQYSSKVLGLDIDFQNSPSKARMALRVLYHAVTKYIPPEAVICSFSGNKGYHLDIFFAEAIPKGKLETFYHKILDETGYKKTEVEARGIGSQGYKLPLGWHQKTGGYCYLCDSDSKPLEDELGALRAVQKAKTYLLDEAIKDIHEEQQVRQEKDLILSEIKPLEVYSDPAGVIKHLERVGITEPNTRHNTARMLAHFYNMQGLEQAEIEQKLIEWHKGLDKNLYDSAWPEIKKDCKELALNAVTYKGFKWILRRPVITKAEVLQALEIKGKPLRRLYYTLLIHAKTYADKETGIFYMTYKQINEALGNTSQNRGHLRKQLDKLEQLGLLEVVRAGKLDPTSEKPKSLPNQYKLLNVNLRAKPTDGFVVCDKTCPCSFCFDVAINYLLEKEEIQQAFRPNDRQDIYSAKCEIAQ